MNNRRRPSQPLEPNSAQRLGTVLAAPARVRPLYPCGPMTLQLTIMSASSCSRMWQWNK